MKYTLSFITVFIVSKYNNAKSISKQHQFSSTFKHDSLCVWYNNIADSIDDIRSDVKKKYCGGGMTEDRSKCQNQFLLLTLMRNCKHGNVLKKNCVFNELETNQRSSPGFLECICGGLRSSSGELKDFNIFCGQNKIEDGPVIVDPGTHINSILCQEPHCRHGHGVGRCVCNMIYIPVCGEDGETYPNTCTARCKNVDVMCQVKEYLLTPQNSNFTEFFSGKVPL